MGLLATVVKVYFLSISVLSFPTMLHQDKKTVSTDTSNQTEGRNVEFESTRSKPLNVGPKLEEDEYYPTEVIEEALKSASSVVKEFLRRPVNSVGHQISKRDTPDQDEFTQRLCPVTRSIFRPRNPRHSVEPGDESLYFPLNLPNRGEDLPQVFQAVQAVTCETEGLNTATNFLQGHDSWCKQEYMDLPMVALVQNTTTLVITRLRFPTSCSCYLRP
jgi:hypothetical protein